MVIRCVDYVASIAWPERLDWQVERYRNYAMRHCRIGLIRLKKLVPRY
jgi:hypothetical protein